MTESEEELKNLLMSVKEENEKADLKLSIQKMKIMVSSPINSWEIDGETMETVQIVTAAMKLKEACSLEETDITLPTKVHVVKAMVFPVVMYGCQS